MYKLTTPNKNYNEIFESLAQKTRQNIIGMNTGPVSVWALAIGNPVSLELATVYQRISTMIDKMSIFTATGSDLDKLLNDFNFYRKQPSPASGDWTTRDSVPGTILQIGLLTVNKADGTTYKNTQEIIIDGSGVGIIPVECEISGISGNADIGEISGITSSIAGIGSGENEAAFADGQDQESDAEFLDRYLKGYTASYWNLDGIFSEISQLDGVSSVKVYENDKETLDPLTNMNPKSIFAIVEGGNEQDIAEALYRKTDSGIERMGDTEITVLDLQGNDRIIKFSRPNKTDIEFYFQYSGTANSTQIKDSIINYINAEEIAGTLSNVGAWEEIRKNTDISKIDSFSLYMRRSGDISFIQNLVYAYNENGNAVEVPAP